MKKIISAILALAMCVSLLPATVLFASAAGETVYTFSTTALNSENGKTGTGTDVYYRDTNIYKNTSGAVDNFNLKYVCGTGNHGWKYFGHTAVPADVVLGMRHMQLMVTGILSTINNASHGAVTQLDLAFELEQPTKGFYTVSYENDVSSGVTGYIGAKKSSAISDYINEKHLLGNVTTANAVTAYPGKVIYSDGVTPLVYAFRTTTNVTTKSLTLKTNNSTVSFAIEDTRLNVGDTTTASVKVGNDVLVNSFVDYSVPADSCVEIDDCGNIKANSTGKTTVTAKVGDESYTASVTVRSAEDAYYYNFMKDAGNLSDEVPVTERNVPLMSSNIPGVYRNVNALGAFKVYGFGDHGWRGLAFDYDKEVAFNQNMVWTDEEQTYIRDIYDHPTHGLQFDLSGITAAFLIDAPAEGIYAVAASLAETASDIYISKYKNDISYSDVYGTDNPAVWNSSSYSIKKVSLSKYTAEEQLAVKEFQHTSLGNCSRYIYSDGKTPLVLAVSVPDGGTAALKQLRLSPAKKLLSLSIADAELLVGETTTASVKDTGTWTVVNDFVTYSVPEDSCIEIDGCGNITAKSVGTAIIKATVGDEVYTANVTVYEEDEELKDAFDDATVGPAPNDYIAPTVTAIDAEGIVGDPIPVSGGAYKITAAETSETKGNFLYWKKAMTVNEKIVSFDREFNYVPEGNERNILVAVYEGDINSTAPKCYNANGQYLPDAEPVDDDLPSMAGYGKAYKWGQYGNTNVWVAQYETETPIADIDVTVTGDNTSGGGTNLAYGAEVTCTATGENFKCWKKTYGDGTAKIVSTDSVYKFNAWENCAVEAIYEEDVHYTGSKMKIIIDSFIAGDETGVMAEFLGFGNNVVEKGIMFNDNRIAMTTVGNQFSVIADKNGTYNGYAIIEEADGLKLITDGSYTE